MGLYDTIKGTLICPYCNKKTIVQDQIKWTDFPYLGLYEIGDIIDAEDGEYDYGSGMRSTLNDWCKHCNRRIYFMVTVECGKLNKIEINTKFLI